jgi:hypothetical protein
MLGHASATMTLDVYAGLFDDQLEDIADRMYRAAMGEDGIGPDADSVRTDEAEHGGSNPEDGSDTGSDLGG